MNPSDFSLTESEKRSALWLKLKAHFEEKLQGLRALNDQQQPEGQTAHNRGRIAQVKEFLALERAPEEEP